MSGTYLSGAGFDAYVERLHAQLHEAREALARIEGQLAAHKAMCATLAAERDQLRAERDEAHADLNAWILDRGIAPRPTGEGGY